MLGFLGLVNICVKILATAVAFMETFGRVMTVATPSASGMAGNYQGLRGSTVRHST